MPINVLFVNRAPYPVRLFHVDADAREVPALSLRMGEHAEVRSRSSQAGRARSHSGALLMELAGGSRLKEMLAQGISNSHFRDRAAEKEQEKAERRRLVPYHMWINLDLVEAVHLVTAMLLELPNLAHNAYDPKRRSAPVSRTFRRYLDQHERQVFTGPPEGTRDYVMRTSKLLLDTIQPRLVLELLRAGQGGDDRLDPVSYTHLTLPTKA